MDFGSYVFGKGPEPICQGLCLLNFDIILQIVGSQ